MASFTSVTVFYTFLFTLIFCFCIEYVLLREKINYYTSKRDGGGDQCGVLQPKEDEKGTCEGEGTADAQNGCQSTSKMRQGLHRRAMAVMEDQLYTWDTEPIRKHIEDGGKKFQIGKEW